MNKHVFKKIAELEKTHLSEVKIELANTFNQVVDRHKFLEKTIAELTKQYNEIKTVIVKYKPEMENQTKDLDRIYNALKELGMNDDAQEIGKYMNSGVYKEFDSLYNSIK